jgi:cytochrome c553
MSRKVVLTRASLREEMFKSNQPSEALPMLNKQKITIHLIAFAMALCLLVEPAIATGPVSFTPMTATERDALFPSRETIEFGRIAAEANCAGCHGMDGASQAEGQPHLAGQRMVYMYRALKAFQSGQRADELKHHNKLLNDQALLSTAIYYSNLAPVSAVVEMQDETGAGTEDLAGDPFAGIRGDMRKCIKCHEETGNSQRAGMPSLTAQHPDYFVKAMMAYVDGSRDHRLMGRLVGELDEATIRAMGVYYAVQEPLATENPGDGDVEAGKLLAEECAACHGVDGNASKPTMPSLAGQDAKYFIKGMNHYKNGERNHEKMFEAVEKLTEQQMSDLASYYAVQKPIRRNVRMPLNSAEWVTRCERCHGIDGNSSDPRFPMLAGQDALYLQRALSARASGDSSNSTMHAMAAPLTASDIERIAGYFSAQTPKAVVYMQLPCGEEQK